MLATKECEIVNVNVDPNNEMELQDLKLKKPESFTSKYNFGHLLLELRNYFVRCYFFSYKRTCYILKM